MTLSYLSTEVKIFASCVCGSHIDSVAGSVCCCMQWSTTTLSGRLCTCPGRSRRQRAVMLISSAFAASRWRASSMVRQLTRLQLRWLLPLSQPVRMKLFHSKWKSAFQIRFRQTSPTQTSSCRRRHWKVSKILTGKSLRSWLMSAAFLIHTLYRCSMQHRILF